MTSSQSEGSEFGEMREVTVSMNWMTFFVILFVCVGIGYLLGRAT